MRRPREENAPRNWGWELKTFGQDDLDDVHHATLEVMEQVGIRVEGSEEAVEFFYSSGAKVERNGHHAIVKIPSQLVEDCIGWAPKTIVLKGRTPECDFSVKPGRVCFTTFGEMIQIIDPDTRQIRSTSQKDCADIARLSDSFDEVAVVQRAVASLDKPPGAHPVYNAEALFENTSKHVLIGPINASSLRAIIKIAAAHVGGTDRLAERMILTTIVCSSSPLRLEKDCADLIIESAKQEGGGIVSSSVPLVGLTTPSTLAGTLVCVNAEVLSGVVLAQLVRRGTRVLYSNSGTMMDLMHMTSCYGAPETGMLSAAVATMARYYHLPCHCTGIQTDSKELDPQIGYESAMAALVTALSGANIINGLGSLELGLTFDYAKFMLDVECVRMMEKIRKGIPFAHSQMAVDVIEEVGPGGEFVTHKHTLDHMRERSQTSLFDRRSREMWSHSETREIIERAYDGAKRILETYQPQPVPEDIQREVTEIIKEYLSESGLSA